jgi:hypothetical protein
VALVYINADGYINEYDMGGSGGGDVSDEQ